MTITLDLNNIEDNVQALLIAQTCASQNHLQTSFTEEQVQTTVSVDVTSKSQVVGSLVNVAVDSTNDGSSFANCPTAQIPADFAVNPDACMQKIDAFVQYTKALPTEPKGIENFLAYANNLANAGLLTAQMKKRLIRSISAATQNSCRRASAKGFEGLRGQDGSSQFVNDALASFKPVETSSSHVAVVLQTLRALNGKLVMTNTEDNHPSASEIKAQNYDLMKSIGLSAPSQNTLGSSRANGVGSKSTPPVAPSSQPQSSAPAPNLPTPVLPDSGSKCPPDFSQSGSTVGLKGIKDYFSQLLLYIHAHPTDITAMQHLMDFFVKISNLYGGNIPADIQAVLNAGSGGGIAESAIASIIPKLEQYAFFTGFSVGGKVINGEAGMQAYVGAMRAALGGASHTPYTDAMSGALASSATISAYAKQHTDAKTGELFYTVNLPNPKLGAQFNVRYDWDGVGSDPKDLMTPQYFILQQINSRGPDLLDESTTADPFNTALDANANQILTTYRVSALKDLLAQFKDPLTAISIWIMTSFDNQYQTAEGGLTDTTDTLTEMTNSVATRLSTLAQDIGFTGYDKDGMPTGQKMTPQQAQDFADTLANGTGLMDSLFQLNGISSEWDKNVFQDICGIPLTNPAKMMPDGSQGGAAYPEPFPKTVGDLLYGVKADGTPAYTAAQKATYLSTLSMGPPPVNKNYDPTKAGNPSEPPAETQGYQQLVGDLQQAGSFITGRSKTVTQQLTQTTDLDSSAIKAFSTMLQDLQQFILKGPIAGQKQN